MVYKLVCIDMDGTLLNRKGKIAIETKNALIEAHKKGVHIVINTGRIYNNAAYYSNLLGVKSPVIAANGAFIREKDSEKVIYSCGLGKGQCRDILDVALKYNLVPHFHTYNKVFVASRFHRLISYLVFSRKLPENMKIKSEVVSSKEKWYKVFEENENEIVKCIIFHTDSKKISEVKEQLKTIESLEVVSSGSHNIEINAKGVSKGNAAKVLANYYGLKSDEVICIGDNENDISMIEYAGLGVAMGNALTIVKEKADYVTATNDEHGVAKVIEKFILNI